MLTVTPMPKCLERKLIFLGLEIGDLMAVFMTLSVLNFTIGPFVPSRALFVWMPSLILAAVLYFGKRGKPENFLLHYMRFHLSQKYYSAWNTKFLATLKIKGDL